MTTIGTGTGAFFQRNASGIAALRARAEALQQQVSTGQRLTRGSDDPLAAARLRTLARSDKLAEADGANASRAQTDLSMADDALGQVADQMGRVKELATLAATGTLSDKDRAAVGAELSQIHDSLLALANSRDSAGHALFGGEGTGAAYTVDASGQATYAGTASAGTLDLGEGQTVTRGLTGPQAFGFTGPSGPTDLMAVVRQLAADLQGGAADPAQAARDALGPLDSGLDQVTTSQALVGARLASLDMAADRRATTGETRAGEEADLGGADLSTAVAKLQQLMLALEASQASFAKLSSLSLFDSLR